MYLLNIKIADEFIYAVYPWSTKKRELILQKQANFDLSKIEQISKELEFDASLLESSLAFDDFSPAFEQFETQGLDHNIRQDRSCTFWVGVWDHTSRDNKEGYQKAYERTVGEIFNTFRYREDKWPH